MMKRIALFLVFLVILAALAVPAQAQLNLPTTPAGGVRAPIDSNGWKNFYVSLTQNVTAFQFTGIPTPAQAQVNVLFVQNSTGNFTVTYAPFFAPTGEVIAISNGCTPTTTPLSVTVCQFVFNNNNNTWIGIPIGSSGGAGNPASPGCALQLSNLGITAFATSTGINAVPLGIDSCGSPTTLNVPYNLSITGYRPYTDVTAYGAKGDGVTHDTAAVQAAIVAACAAQGTVFFPSGNYIIDQTQGASTVPDLVPGTGCNGAGHGLYILGQGSNGAGGSFVPQSRITVSLGASPSLAPLFGVTNSGGTYGVGTSRIENMMLSCYNQCFANVSGGNTKLINDTMFMGNATQVNCSASGCITDSAPVAFYGSLENYIEGGTYSNTSTAGCPTAHCPSIVLATDVASHASGLIFLKDNILFGQVLDEGLTSPGAGWGFVAMHNTIFEALGNQPAFETINFGSVTSFASLTMDGITLVSDSNPGIPLVQFNGGSFYTGIDIHTATPAVSGPLIKVISGVLSYCEATPGSASSSTGGIVDGSGNPLLGCVTSTALGKGLTGPAAYTNSQGYYSTFWPAFQFSGAPIEMAVTGENNASLALDPLMGLLQGPGGTVGGYDLSVVRAANSQTLSVSFARAISPTVITATPSGSGGTLAAGNYNYAVVSAVATPNCNTITNYWLTASATTTGTTSSVVVGWTLPTDTSQIIGYCVLRNPSTTSAVTAIFVAGATTVTYTDIGTGGSVISGPIINNTFPTTPQYSFSKSTLNASQNIATTPDGVHPSGVQYLGNTTLPGLTANTVTDLGPPVATFTAWSFQRPSTVPPTGSILACVTTGVNCLMTPATAAQLNAIIQGLTGCNTATFVYTPQAAACVAPSAAGGFNGSVTYTTSQGATTADNGKLVLMNCASACAYTLPATQPSTTWQAWVMTIGATNATIALSGDTFNGGASVPVLNKWRTMFIAANTAASTDYEGDAPLSVAGGLGTNVFASTFQIAATIGSSNPVSASTNFGATVGSTSVASFFNGAIVGIYVYQSLAGVGCSAASNTAQPTITFNDPNGNTQTIAGPTLTITGNGSVANGSGTFTQSLVAIESNNSVNAITFTAASTLASTGCSTTPQYKVGMFVPNH